MRLPVGVGIIGVGTIGRLHLEAAWRLGASVVAIAGRDATRTRALSAELGITGHEDYQALLADPAVRVVHVCTPDALHYPIARDALLAGKHVVCEKPLALASHESRALLELADRLGLVHAVGFNNRFYPLIREAQARIADGQYGRVFAVRGFILEDSLLADSAFDWRLIPALGGTSSAMSTIGSHLVDLVSFVVGSPVQSVCAEITTVHPVRRPPGGASTPVVSEEVASILVRFESGVRGVLGVSRATAGRRYLITVEADGTDGSLVWNSETPNQLWGGHNARPNEVLLRDPALLSAAARPFAQYPGAYQEAFPDTIRAMLDRVYHHVVAGGTADYATFADGHAALLVHEAVLTSARTRAWVDVEPALVSLARRRAD